MYIYMYNVCKNTWVSIFMWLCCFFSTFYELESICYTYMVLVWFYFHKKFISFILYHINIKQYTHNDQLNPVWVSTLLSSLIARRWVGLQTLWWFRLKDLSIDEMVGAWCFGCLSGPPGFTCWISFAPVFSLIYCWVLILALSPCYILIYMF